MKATVRKPLHGKSRASWIVAEKKYGVQVVANRVIRAVQVYAPCDKDFVAIEPQMNYGDPFNREIWSGRNTGIAILKPGKALEYKVQVSVFTRE